MKLVAGSILASGGLLILALAHLTIRTLPFPGDRFVTAYYMGLGSPVQVITILFIIAGIVLIIWGLSDTKTKKE
jgi:hypothetical protein